MKAAAICIAFMLLSFVVCEIALTVYGPFGAMFLAGVFQTPIGPIPFLLPTIGIALGVPMIWLIAKYADD